MIPAENAEPVTAEDRAQEGLAPSGKRDERKAVPGHDARREPPRTSTASSVLAAMVIGYLAGRKRTPLKDSDEERRPAA